MGQEPSLSVVFQPIADLLTGNVIGYEALGRIPGRETLGFSEVERVVGRDGMDRVRLNLYRMSLNQGAFRPPGTLLFVNVTRVMLQELLFTSDTLHAFTDIVFEMPESDHSIDAWEHLMVPFREEGVLLAVDDWGIGHADPLRVAQLRPNWVKIDRALIRQIGQDPFIDRLITLLVNWFKDSHCHIIAEGIERPEQIIRLRQLGVRWGQGFGLALPEDRFVETVAIPSPGLRFGQISGLPLSLSQMNTITDEHLAVIERYQQRLYPIIDHAVENLASWIEEIPLGPNLLATSSRIRFAGLLRHHFHALVRGYLGGEDLERAAKIVQTHRRFTIDLAWFTAGFHRLHQSIVSDVKKEIGSKTLDDAIDQLLLWDMTLILSEYQRVLEHDETTSLLLRRPFFDSVALDIEFRLKRHQPAHLVLIQVYDLDNHSTPTVRRALQQIGHALARYQSARVRVGYLDAGEFAMWLDNQESLELNRLLRHLKEDLAAGGHRILQTAFSVATLGVEGTTLNALYLAAESAIEGSGRPTPYDRSGGQL